MDVENPEIQTPAQDQPAIDQSPVEEPKVSQDQQPDKTDDGLEKGPSKEDLTKGIAKWKNISKEMETENIKLRAQLQSQPQPQPSFSNPSLELDQNAQAGVELIRSVIREELTPMQQQAQEERIERTTREFWQKPYAQTLAPEIQEEFKETPANLSYGQRLELARNAAIANNIETVKAVHEEIGMEKAYTNQAVKRSQGGSPTESARTTQEPKTLLDRLRSGELSSEEYKQNRGKILELERKEAGL